MAAPTTKVDRKTARLECRAVGVSPLVVCRTAAGEGHTLEEQLYREPGGRIAVPSAWFVDAMLAYLNVIRLRIKEGLVEWDGKLPGPATFRAAVCPAAQWSALTGVPELRAWETKKAGRKPVRCGAYFDPWWADVDLKYDPGRFDGESLRKLLKAAGVMIGLGHYRPGRSWLVKTKGDGAGTGGFGVFEVEE